MDTNNQIKKKLSTKIIVAIVISVLIIVIAIILGVLGGLGYLSPKEESSVTDPVICMYESNEGTYSTKPPKAFSWKEEYNNNATPQGDKQNDGFHSVTNLGNVDKDTNITTTNYCDYACTQDITCKSWELQNNTCYFYTDYKPSDIVSDPSSIIYYKTPDTCSGTLSPSPTQSPTTSPTQSPTESPTISPTTAPTQSPTESPTQSPTKSPIGSPTQSPVIAPTTSPTTSPTNSPTTSPTNSPTMSPTTAPTKAPVPPKICDYNSYPSVKNWKLLYLLPIADPRITQAFYCEDGYCGNIDGLSRGECFDECTEDQRCVGIAYNDRYNECAFYREAEPDTNPSSYDVYLKNSACTIQDVSNCYIEDTYICSNISPIKYYYISVSFNNQKLFSYNGQVYRGNDGVVANSFYQWYIDLLPNGNIFIINRGTNKKMYAKGSENDNSVYSNTPSSLNNIMDEWVITRRSGNKFRLNARPNPKCVSVVGICRNNGYYLYAGDTDITLSLSWNKIQTEFELIPI